MIDYNLNTNKTNGHATCRIFPYFTICPQRKKLISKNLEYSNRPKHEIQKKIGLFSAPKNPKDLSIIRKIKVHPYNNVDLVRTA